MRSDERVKKMDGWDNCQVVSLFYMWHTAAATAACIEAVKDAESESVV